MSGFDLRSVVRSVLAESSAADPGVIGMLVMARIPDELSRAALQAAIGHFVRQVISEQRLRVPIGDIADVAKANGGYVSPKVRAIAEDWRIQLRNRYEVTGNTGRGQQVWKRLADMTFDDLVNAASVRERMARKNIAKAEYLRNLAMLVQGHDATTVEDLPDAVLAEALGGVA